MCICYVYTESLLKGKDHVGFCSEVAWVTHFGEESLQRLCVRPTSETLFCDIMLLFSLYDLQSFYNQWCSVVRCEKTTRPFKNYRLLWQEVILFMQLQKKLRKKL